MNRRKFAEKAGSMAVLAAGASIIPFNLKAENSIENQYVLHYVLFWLKPDLNQTQIIGFAGFFEELRKIKTIKTLSYGLAASTAQRDVVDNSFSYALSVTFANLADQEAYQKDPIHLKAIEKYSSSWTKVLVQ